MFFLIMNERDESRRKSIAATRTLIAVNKGGDTMGIKTIKARLDKGCQG